LSGEASYGRKKLRKLQNVLENYLFIKINVKLYILYCTARRDGQRVSSYLPPDHFVRQIMCLIGGM